MTTLATATDSRIEELRIGSQTFHPTTEDWLIPHLDPHRPLIEKGTSNGSPLLTQRLNTDATPRPEVAEPIRKDKLAIAFPSRINTLLHQWECTIIKECADTVECEMHDLTEPGRTVEYGEVFLNAFNHFDRHLLREGAVFYWSVGQETNDVGQVRTFSQLRVRRMPPLTSLQSREIMSRAERLSELFE
jgi:hypothetical protein